MPDISLTCPSETAPLLLMPNACGRVQTPRLRVAQARMTAALKERS